MNDDVADLLVKNLNTNDPDVLDAEFMARAANVPDDALLIPPEKETGSDTPKPPKAPRVNPEIKLLEAIGKELERRDKEYHAGTCEPGERSDLTGCTPGKGGSSNKPGKKIKPSKLPSKPQAPQIEETEKTNPEVDSKVNESIKEPGFLKKVASLPKKLVTKAASAASSLYKKTETKYGPRWAKAILATAIITMPTPFTMLSVATMTGLAHVWTGYVSKTRTKSLQHITKEQLIAAAKEFIKELENALRSEVSE